MIMVVIKIKDGTLDQYDQVTKEVLGGTLQPSELPDGLLSHTAVMADDEVKVVDVWNSKEQFDTFGQKLMPALGHAGIMPTEPKIYEVHNFLKA